MTVYRFDRRAHFRQHPWRYIFVSLAVAAALLVAGYLFLTRSNDTGAEGKAVEVSNNPFQQINTDYFRFDVSNNWKLAADLGNNVDTFVYRKFKDQNPAGLLTISVNKPNDLLITHVLPVSIKDGRITEIGEPSDHCAKSLPAGLNQDPHGVVVEQVSFRCWTDGTIYLIAVGQRDGNLVLPLQRGNGILANYIITYQNTSFDVDEAAILEVVKTFEAK